MAAPTVTPDLDHAAIAAGLGELKHGPGYARLVVDGKTLAYLKKATVSVPAALVARAPKKLGSFKVEANGQWAGASADSTVKARAILEYVAAKARQS